jgi:RNA polymerase sigma factor (sigma-70 family)
MQTRKLKYLLGDTPEEAEESYNKFAGFLNKIASAYAHSTGLEKADLFGEAVLGLAEAKASFDPKRGSPFTKWASFKITDALNNYVANNASLIRVPEYILLSNKLVNKFRIILELCTDDNDLVNLVIYTGDATKAHLPAWAEEKVTHIITTLQKSAKRAHISYKELVSRANYVPEISKITRDLQQKEVDEEKHILLQIHVKQLQRRMNDREREIAELIMQGQDYAQIAKHFSRSPGWVTAQLKQMKEKFKDEGGQI